MPAKFPEKPKYNCPACQDTKKNSQGGDCFPCSINRQIEREYTKPIYSHEPTVRKDKKPLKQLPKRPMAPKRFVREE